MSNEINKQNRDLNIHEMIDNLANLDSCITRYTVIINDLVKQINDDCVRECIKPSLKTRLTYYEDELSICIEERRLLKLELNKLSK